MDNKTSVINSIKTAYPHLSDLDVNIVYDTALYDYLTLRNPFDKSKVDIDVGEKRDFMWVRKRMIDLIEREGASNAVAYSENGLSIRFDNANISKSLASQIIPNVGVPK